MSDNALIDRSSREWSQGAVTDNVKMEINDREQACDESTSVDHDDSLNVENNLFEMYFARISPNKSLHLLEIPKDSVENDRNQVDAVEIKFVKDELHSQSAAESEDELCLDNVDHVKELGNLCDDKHGIQLV
jgi:hypothetical protein